MVTTDEDRVLLGGWTQIRYNTIQYNIKLVTRHV